MNTISIPILNRMKKMHSMPHFCLKKGVFYLRRLQKEIFKLYRTLYNCHQNVRRHGLFAGIFGCLNVEI